MAKLVTNDIYLTADGFNIAGLFTDFSLEFSSDGVETTTGGSAWKTRDSGVKDASGKLTVTYETTQVPSYIQTFAPSKIPVFDYGAEKNIAGKPRHTQALRVASISHKISANREHVTFEISLESAAAPTNDMHAGATW